MSWYFHPFLSFFLFHYIIEINNIAIIKVIMYPLSPRFECSYPFSLQDFQPDNHADGRRRVCHHPPGDDQGNQKGVDKGKLQVIILNYNNFYLFLVLSGKSLLNPFNASHFASPKFQFQIWLKIINQTNFGMRYPKKLVIWTIDGCFFWHAHI